MLVSVTADAFCAAQAGHLHAVPWEPVLYLLGGHRRRKTWDTVCGLRRARLVAIPAVRDGEPQGHYVLPWPPYARYDQWARCRGCWEATGRRRPHQLFRELREQGQIRAEQVA